MWAFINPILLMVTIEFYDVFNSFSLNALLRFLSFYMIFGGIWPLTIIVYPGFLNSATVVGNQLYEALVYTALFGPPITLAIQFYRHKKFVEKNKEKPLTWSDYFWDFL